MFDDPHTLWRLAQERSRRLREEAAAEALLRDRPRSLRSRSGAGPALSALLGAIVFRGRRTGPRIGVDTEAAGEALEAPEARPSASA
jgi:hypothetical protein